MCNTMQKLIMNIMPVGYQFTINQSKIHTASFRDKLKLLESPYNDNLKSNNELSNQGLSISSNYTSVRHKGKKGKWAVSPMKTSAGNRRGKSRGLKVYDGQRVPIGTCLVNQLRPNIFPGWNVRFGWTNRLHATVHGRVMITTELADLNWENYTVEKHIARGSQHLKQEKIFRNYIHVIPDVQHQYFKLV